MKNEEAGQLQVFENSREYRKEVAFDILLCGGPSNSLEDRNVCFECGRKTVEESKKLKNSKTDTWVIFVKLYFLNIEIDNFLTNIKVVYEKHRIIFN